MTSNNDRRRPPSVGEFAKALRQNWFDAMSGGASVPLGIVGLYVENNMARFGLMATAFLCAWTAGYRIWAEERRRVIELDPEMPERISIIDFAKIAERDHGWDFKSGWEALDLFLAIRHAANEGILQLRGREFKYGSPPKDAWRRAQLLFRDVPRDDWDKFQLGLHGPISENFLGEDNFDIVVTSVMDDAPRLYDPQLTDRARAVRWLEQRGGSTRGFSERTHREEVAERQRRGSGA